MNKRKIHHVMTLLKPVSYWYFVVIFVVSAGIAMATLRQNNLRALELRDNVLEVDKQDGDIEAALRELREYTYGHMNSRLSSDTGVYPPIQLKYRYERLLQAEKQRVEASKNDVYDEAQRYCESQYGAGSLREGRVPCVQKYVDDHAAKQVEAQIIPDAMYKFDFVSPVWSPDVAGWSLVIAGFALTLLITRISASLWLKHQLEG